MKEEDRSLKIMTTGNAPPTLCIVGFSNSGKTTILVGLVGALKARDFRVGTVKHDVHGFEMDHRGKDSWRHKQAGASMTIISAPGQIGMVMDVDHDYHPLELMPFLAGMDIILMEGFKGVSLPKIEVFRGDNGVPPACRGDKNLIAVVSDSDLQWGVPRFSTDNIDGLAAFVLRYFGLASPISPFREQKFR